MGSRRIERVVQIIETFINHDWHLTTVRPELVEGLRQAQPERCGVMNYERWSWPARHTRREAASCCGVSVPSDKLCLLTWYPDDRPI